MTSSAELRAEALRLGLSLHGSVANVVIGFPFAASRSWSKWVIYQPEC